MDQNSSPRDSRHKVTRSSSTRRQDESNPNDLSSPPDAPPQVNPSIPVLPDSPRDTYRPFGPSMPQFLNQQQTMLYHPHFNQIQPQHPPFPNPVEEQNPRDQPLHNNFAGSAPYSGQQQLSSGFPLNSDPSPNSVSARDGTHSERAADGSSIRLQPQMPWPTGNQGADTDNSNPPDVGDIIDDALLQPMSEKSRRETERQQSDATTSANAINAPPDNPADDRELANMEQQESQRVPEMQEKKDENAEAVEKEAKESNDPQQEQENVDVNSGAANASAETNENPTELSVGEQMDATSAPKDSANGDDNHDAKVTSTTKNTTERGSVQTAEIEEKRTEEDSTAKNTQASSQESNIVPNQVVAETKENEMVQSEVPTTAENEKAPSPNVKAAANTASPIAQQRKDVGDGENKKSIDPNKVSKDAGSDSDCVIIGYSKPDAPTTVPAKAAGPSLTVLPLNQRTETMSRSRYTAQPKASSLSLADVASSGKPSPGNQGSAVEYRRLVQKHGQAMSYNVGQTVLFFVPRLASRARFKDRLGTIMRRCDDSRYVIQDQQNNRTETVPWKWILKAPPTTSHNTRKRSALQRDLNSNVVSGTHTAAAKRLKMSGQQQQQMERIPINSLQSKEDKIKEFDRRMNSRKGYSKQYSVPIHSSYYDDDDGYTRDDRDLRGRSLHHDVHPAHQRRFTARNLRSPPPQNSRRKLIEDSRPHSGYKQMRSFSVFPQRVSRCARRCRSPPPPLRGDLSPITRLSSPPQAAVHGNTSSSTTTTTTTTSTNTSTSTTESEPHRRADDTVNISNPQSNDDTVEIKPESASTDTTSNSKRSHAEDSVVPNTNPVDDDLGAQHRYTHHPHRPHGAHPSVVGRPIYPEHNRRPRSRSRSPSHIRPSNRILMKDSADSNVTPSTPRDGRFPDPMAGSRYSRHPRRYPMPPPSRMDPFYDGYYRRYRDHRYFRESLPPPDYPRDLQPPRYSSPPPPKPPTPPPAKLDLPIGMKASQSMHRGRPHRSRSRSRSRERMRDYYGMMHPHYAPYDYADDRDRREHFYYHDRRERDHRRFAYYGADRRESEGYYGGDDRSKRPEGSVNGNNSDRLSQSLLMQSWLQVQLRMRGGSKLAEREINYLCHHDIYPENIKQMMDADKPVQEKYDLVAHYVDPTNGQNLSRSQVYSIIGAIITMKF